MSENKLRNIWLLAILLTVSAFVCLFMANQKMKASLKGDLIFASAEGEIPAFDAIKINKEGKQITLRRDDNFWRVEEADNYYANFTKIQSLLENITTSKIGTEIEPNTKNINWTSVTLLNQNQKVGTVEISNATSPATHYIRYPGKNKIYLSNWQTQLPLSLSSWTQQPLLAIKKITIKKIEKDDVIIARRGEGSAFYDVQRNLPYIRSDYLQMFDILNDLRYDKVLSSQEFDNERYAIIEQIRLTSFDGLITTIQIYTDFQRYWIKIELSETTLPSKETKEYIAKNKILYEDWWFEVTPEIGQSLFSLRL